MKFVAHFVDVDCSTVFCFAFCYCTVVDYVNKQFGFHGNTTPSRKQRVLINPVLTVRISAKAAPNMPLNAAI